MQVSMCVECDLTIKAVVWRTGTSSLPEPNCPNLESFGWNLFETRSALPFDTLDQMVQGSLYAVPGIGTV